MDIVVGILTALSRTVGLAILTGWLTIGVLFALLILVGMLSSYYSRQRRQSKLWPRMNA